MTDSAPPPRDSGGMLADTGSVIPPPAFDAGNGGATQDVTVPSQDAGASQDTGTVTPSEDTGTAPTEDAATLDTSTPEPTEDAGPDTSTPPPMDAALDTGGGSVDTGTEPPDTSTNPNQCSSTPAYATTTSCAQCTCSKCGPQIATCFASSDATKNSQCRMVQACAEQNKCVQQGCYCGNSSTCLAPNGPCVNIIEQVAGGGPLSVQRAEQDANHALGRASLVGGCQLQNCKAECGL